MRVSTRSSLLRLHWGPRCIQVTWSTTNDSPLAWGEFANKVKDSLMTAFDAAVSQREEEVRRSESQQSMPGWNFCTFFILKVRFAYHEERSSLTDLRKVSQARMKG